MDFLDAIPAFLFRAQLDSDAGLRLCYCNGRSQDLFALPKEELQHQPNRLLQGFSLADQQALKAAIALAISQQTPSELELELHPGSARARWYLVQITAFHDPDHGAQACGLMTDITQSHTAKLRALTTADYCTQLLDSLPDHFYYKDRESRFMGGNRAWYSHHGYDSLHDIVGKSDADSLILADEIKRQSLEQEQEMMRTGHSVHVIEHFVDQAGREVYADALKVPLYNHNQDIIGLVGITRDITEAVKTQQALAKAQLETEQNNITTRVLEAALREGSALLAALNMHAIVSIADKRGTILDVNDAFCSISGYSREELVGQNHRLINSGVHPRQFWSDMWRDIAQGKPWRKSLCNRAKNGSLYWVDTFIAPFKDGDGSVEKYISIRTDITQAKTQEANLRSARDQLEKAAAVAELGIWVWDLEANQLDWNPQMHAIYQVPATVRGQTLLYQQWLACLHPEDRDATEAHLQAALAGTLDYDLVFRIQQPSGPCRYIHGAGFVERDHTGRALKMMGINRDITQQYATEATLRQAKQAAETANQAKSEFLANMSHELRTPMNAILGMLTLLHKTELSHRQADYVAKTQGAAQSLLGLLNDILDLSKAEAGKMLLDPQVFSLETLLRNLSVLLQANTGNKGLQLLFDLDPQIPPGLLGDAMRLQQVLLNLGANAIKFTERGEVVIAIELQEHRGSQVELKFSVRDTGIGIAPENQARIFSGFTQAEASTTRRFGGTGLGLAISRHLVGLMGGQLELTSHLGQGSCFYFTLTLPVAPLALEQAQAQVHEQMHEQPRASREGPGVAHKLRVLVVDDNPTALDITARMVESLGWSLARGSSGAQALAHLQRQLAQGQGVDAIFIDWKMPDMDGWQLSAALAQLPWAQAPRVIMVTAHDRDQLSQRSSQEQGLIHGFLMKPVTAAMLAEALDEASSPTPIASPAPQSSQRRLMGMHILLVEDNLTNQQVAQELLEAEGARIEIANHGQEALDRLGQGQSFDLVLMDLQMPVMDGITATRAIRQDLGLKHLPIVAMTANAMAADRDLCLEAGMNNHVGKPFDLQHLVQVLRAEVGWQSAAPALEAAARAQDQPPETRLDQLAANAGVDLKAAIARMAGREDLYLRMLPKFLDNLAALPPKLRSLQGTGQYQEAALQMHSLKGTAGTLGAMALAAQASLAEQQLKADPNPPLADAILDSGCRLISEALPPLQQLLAALSAHAEGTNP